MRVLAVIAALILGLFAAGFTAAVIDGYDTPTCKEVNFQEDCADTGETQNSVSNVTLTIAAGLGVLAALSLFLFGVTGNRPWVRRCVILLVAAVVVFGLTAAITNA